MKSGFVAVVGRPNVGKSTLVNAAVGEKVVITSSRPQTTRNTVRGVLTGDGFQVVFVDTPGLHKPKTALGERLNRLVYGTLAEVDAVVFVVAADQPIGPGDRRIAERLQAAKSPVIFVVNKTDLANGDAVAGQLATAASWDFDAYVPTSATGSTGVDVLVREIVALLPDGPAYFPEGMVTDQPDELLVAEFTREKFLRRLRQELPHSLAVVVSEIEERPKGLHVRADVLVERESQKGMVIGKGGALLRDAGTEARAELETLFGLPVHLDLRVKVEKDWQRRSHTLDRMGF